MLQDANNIRIRSIFVVTVKIAESEGLIGSRNVIFVYTNLDAFVQVEAEIRKRRARLVQEFGKDFFIDLFLYFVP